MNVRCVILHHTGIDKPHYDLMYESAPGGALTTWRLPIWPVTQIMSIERLDDHRRKYLTYQGPVSGNRGQVRQVFAGSCEVSNPATGQTRLEFKSPRITLLIDHRSSGNGATIRVVDGD